MTSAQESKRMLNFAIIGLGLGATATLPAMEGMSEINLVAGADVNPLMRQRFQERYPHTRVYESAEECCSDPEVEAVWVSSPNRFHAEHVITAATHGKHVVVEKPLALDMKQAQQMVDACKDNGVKLIAGHTASYHSAIPAIRRVITSGRIGAVRAIHMLSYTDWMLRPRNADELDPTQGGGIAFRQAPNQVDTVRFLGGGLLRSVRGMTGQWMPERPIAGYYAAYLEFQNGTPVTIVHNGYGYFLANELVPWGSSKHTYAIEERVKVRQAMRAGIRNENEAKAERHERRARDQMEREVGRNEREASPWLPMDPGFLIVSCERGDIRHSKFGLSIYDDEGIHEAAIAGSYGPGRRELVEMYDAVVNDGPIYHDGAWAMGTLEACLAIMESAAQHREIELTHQVSVVDHKDNDVPPSYLDD